MRLTHLRQLRGWLVRLLGMVHRGRREREFAEELESHLAFHIEDNLRAGLSPEEARRQALIKLGGVTWTQELHREQRGLPMLETLIQDLRFGVRMLRKNPGFTLIAVLTLALGIGATTAIFSVVNGVLLKPLPYPRSEELVAATFTADGLGIRDMGMSAAHYFILREQSGTLQEIALYRSGLKGKGGPLSVTGVGEPEPVVAFGVTDSVLSVLGATPLLGRSFTREDDMPGSAETVILTYGYWSHKFGGDRSVIGKSLEVDGVSRTIIGVLPQGFRFLDQADLAMFLPLKLDREKSFLGAFSFGGMARLKPGVTPQQANADIARLLPVVDKSFSPAPGLSLKTIQDWRLAPNLQPLKQLVVGDVDKVLWVLLGGISLVLIIACANLANLLLVRAEARRQELTIRATLGASRGRLAAQLLSESLLLAIGGGLLGLGLAYAALQLLIAMAPQGLPRLNEIGMDGGVMLFALGASLLAGLLFGSVPVFKYAGAGLGLGLREGGRGMSESRERHRARNVLVVVQVSLALVLLVSSGLMIRTFRALASVNPGFTAPAEVQTFGIGIRDTQVKDPERAVRMEEEILRKLEALPGVTAVALSMSVPMDGGGFSNLIFVKDGPTAPGKIPTCRFQFVAPGYFKTLGVPLLTGRDYTWNEIYGQAPVIIVSEKFARAFWGDPSNALGKQIRANEKDDWREVVGVVGNVHQSGVDKEVPNSIYWPILRNNFNGGTGVEAIRNVKFSLRSSRAGSEGLANEIRQAVWAVASYLPLIEVNTLQDFYAKSIARTSFTLVMLAIAGGMALFIGLVGLYGVIAYSVSQRKREFGIRMALGADTREVLRLVIRQGMTVALVGIAIGLAGALGLTRFLSGLLYGVKPGDPLTLVVVSVLLVVVAFLASYLPARQATKIDPMIALRHE